MVSGELPVCRVVSAGRIILVINSSSTESSSDSKATFLSGSSSRILVEVSNKSCKAAPLSARAYTVPIPEASSKAKTANMQKALDKNGLVSNGLKIIIRIKNWPNPPLTGQSFN